MLNALPWDGADCSNVQTEDRIIFGVTSAPVAGPLGSRILAPVGGHATSFLWSIVEAAGVKIFVLPPLAVNSEVETVLGWDRLNRPGAVYTVSQYSSQWFVSAGSSLPLT